MDGGASPMRRPGSYGFGGQGSPRMGSYGMGGQSPGMMQQPPAQQGVMQGMPGQGYGPGYGDPFGMGYGEQARGGMGYAEPRQQMGYADQMQGGQGSPQAKPQKDQKDSKSKKEKNAKYLKALNEQIDAFADKALFIRAIKPTFDKCADARGELDLRATRLFFDLAGQSLLGVPMGGDITSTECSRFDFDGDGLLSFKEAGKMFRRNMLEMQKKYGGAPTVRVATKTPEQAGYHVIKFLAAGGQGSIHLATNSRGNKVALKTYEKSNQNAGTIEDLRAEMEVMKDLERCPHIMHCYEIFQDSEHFYCVDELLPGGDLVDLRKNAKKNNVSLTEEYFLPIFQQAIGALEYMHRHAMMHCDIKEPNIMIKKVEYTKPQIALIDFGMAKWSSSDGMAGGTPGYRPPETNENNIWYPGGDIFSMGVTFFQLLADKVPNEKTGAMGIFQEGAQSLDQVAWFVKTRQPPWYMIQSRFPNMMRWLPKMLNKQLSQRPKAPQLLHDSSFNQNMADDVVMPERTFAMQDVKAAMKELQTPRGNQNGKSPMADERNPRAHYGHQNGKSPAYGYQNGKSPVADDRNGPVLVRGAKVKPDIKQWRGADY